MFAETLDTNWFAKDCVSIANKIARDWDWKIARLTIVVVGGVLENLNLTLFNGCT